MSDKKISFCYEARTDKNKYKYNNLYIIYIFYNMENCVEINVAWGI